MFESLQSQLVDRFSEMTPKLIGVLVIVISYTVLYLLVARLLRKTLQKTSLQTSLQDILVNSLFKWILVLFAIITSLGQLGIDITAALAGVGIVGLAIGFAAQATLGNILAGFSIFMDKLYRRGDWVEIVGKHGQVKNITLRTTKIRTLDNIFIIVPNSEVINNPVTNFSEEGMVRINANIGIGYGESIDQASEVILTEIKAIKGVLNEPAPQVVVEGLGDSSVDLLVRVWVEDAGSDANFKFILLETCKKALDKAGIEIPFPQRVVHQGK